jgi:hypothetical protein
MLAVRRLTLLFVLPVTLVAGLVAPPAAQASAARPHLVPLLAAQNQVAILSPTSGATISSAYADVDAAGSVADTGTAGVPQTLTLLVDGAPVDSEACDPSNIVADCSAALFWDTSLNGPGTHQLTVTLDTSTGTAATSAPVQVTVVVVRAPTVTISTPTGGSLVKGLVTVTATGTVDPASGDAPELMALFVNGVQVGNAQQCSASSHSCTLSFSWDADGLGGAQRLAVGMFTVNQDEAFSATTLVTVINPPPFVWISSLPISGGTVSGTVTITGSATIDPAETDTPYAMVLVVDGVDTGDPMLCPQSPATLHSCVDSFAWNTAGLVGRHNVQVRFTTSRMTTLSPYNYVTIEPGVGKLLLYPSALAPGDLAWAFGRLVQPDGTTGIVGATVHVTFLPPGGPPTVVDAITDGAGQFAAMDRYKASSKLRITAATGPEQGSASTSIVATMYTPISCAVPKTVQHGRAVTIKCFSRRLPDGVRVTLTDADRGVHVLGVATSRRHGWATFSVTFPHKRAYKVMVRATTTDNRRFSATPSSPYSVRIS